MAAPQIQNPADRNNWSVLIRQRRSVDESLTRIDHFRAIPKAPAAAGDPAVIRLARAVGGYGLALDARIWAALASLPLSAYAAFAARVPNDDAYIYIRGAEIFRQEGFAAAFAHYPWAGYSVLLGLAGDIGLGPFAAAHLLNALFFSVLAFAFVGICREFSTDRKLLALAALSILVFPEINEYRFLILRDSGFWAFSLLGLWCLIRYAAEGSWRYALCFCGAMLLAVVFRPEAILYLLLAPLCLLYDRGRAPGERAVLWLRVAAVAAAILLLCMPVGLALDLNLPRQLIAQASAYAPFAQSLFNPEAENLATMAEAIFGEYAATFSARYLPLFLFAGLTAILAAELLYAVGMPFAPLLAWGWWKGWLPPARGKALPVVAFALLNLLTVFAFILLTRYLSSRYAVVFSLALALAVPFFARELLARAKPGSCLAPWLLTLFFLFSAVDSYYSFGRSKGYVADAVSWLQANRGETAALVTNNRTVAWRSGMVAEYDRVAPVLGAEQIFAAAAGDLIVVEMSSADGRLLSRPDIAELLQAEAVLPGADEPRLRIFRRR